jgi:hypothetical protein
LPQHAALPGGQAQGAGTFRPVEIVQIAQIRRSGPLRAHRLHGLFEERGAAAANLAQHEQVVIRLIHAKSESGGNFGALLTDPGQCMFQQSRSIGKPQGVGINGEAQFVSSQIRDRHGRV